MIQIWIILAIISAIFTGLKDIIAKNVLKKDTSPKQIIFEEYLTLLVITLIIFFPKVNFSSFISLWNLYLLKAFTIFFNAYFYFKLLQNYEISLISPLMNLSPIFLIILSSIFLNEMGTPIQILGIIVIIISTYFLEINFHHHQKKEPHSKHLIELLKLNYKTLGMAILMLFLISITAICDKMILNKVSVYTNMYYTAIIITTILIIYYIKTKKITQSIKTIKEQPQILVIALLNNLSTFFVLWAISIPAALVSLVIPIKRISTLFSSLFGGILFHENHLIKKIIATVGMLIGVFLIAL